MKKYVTLFTDSYREFKHVRTITISAMLAAIAIVLGMFSITIGSYIRIGFASIPNGVCAYLFGPVVGSIFSGVLDIIKYLMKPDGAFYPPMTLVTMLAGLLYGLIYYKRAITLPRVFAAKFTVMLICNVLLNTLCLTDLLGTPFLALLPVRAVKNLIMWPIDAMIFFVVAKTLERVGIFRMIHLPGYAE